MFRSFIAWRRLLRSLRHPDQWAKVSAKNVLACGYTRVTIDRDAVLLTVDGTDVPLGRWRRRRLRIAVVGLLLRKI